MFGVGVWRRCGKVPLPGSDGDVAAVTRGGGAHPSGLPQKQMWREYLSSGKQGGLVSGFGTDRVVDFSQSFFSSAFLFP